jgi:predicted DCC family thiol-disulfide oxidoreductase YuxK
MARHLLLWDGACGFCRRAVEGVRRRDRDGRFEIVPYQQAPARGKAVHVLTADGQLLRAGRASLFVLGETGHPWLARILGLPPLVWLVELGYVIVARHRSFFSRLLPKKAPNPPPNRN